MRDALHITTRPCSRGMMRYARWAAEQVSCIFPGGLLVLVTLDTESMHDELKERGNTSLVDRLCVQGTTPMHRCISSSIDLCHADASTHSIPYKKASCSVTIQSIHRCFDFTICVRSRPRKQRYKQIAMASNVRVFEHLLMLIDEYDGCLQRRNLSKYMYLVHCVV